MCTAPGPRAPGPGAEEVSTTLRCPGCARGGYKSIASVPGGVPAPPPWGFLPTHVNGAECIILEYNFIGIPSREFAEPGFLLPSASSLRRARALTSTCAGPVQSSACSFPCASVMGCLVDVKPQICPGFSTCSSCEAVSSRHLLWVRRPARV